MQFVPHCILRSERLDDSLGGDNEIHIISGYRSPSYNSRLRSVSKGVAKKSLHLKGMAVDLVIPGIRLDRIRRNALALATGGVGYYPKAGFARFGEGQSLVSASLGWWARRWSCIFTGY